MRTVLLALLVLGGARGASAADTVCPPELPAVQQNAAEPEGWTRYDEAESGPHKFYYADFSDGPPQQWARLIPTGTTRVQRDRVLIYEFGPRQQPWLVCSYEQTSLTLSQPLPPATRACRVTLDAEQDEQTVKQIDCVQ